MQLPCSASPAGRRRGCPESPCCAPGGVGGFAALGLLDRVAGAGPRRSRCARLPHSGSPSRGPAGGAVPGRWCSAPQRPRRKGRAVAGRHTPGPAGGARGVENIGWDRGERAPNGVRDTKLLLPSRDTSRTSWCPPPAAASRTLTEAESGTDSAAPAQRNSHGRSTSGNGGELGTLTADTLVAGPVKAAFAAPVRGFHAPCTPTRRRPAPRCPCRDCSRKPAFRTSQKRYQVTDNKRLTRLWPRAGNRDAQSNGRPGTPAGAAAVE